MQFNKRGVTLAYKQYQPHITKDLSRELAAMTFLQHDNILRVYAVVVADPGGQPIGLLLQKVRGSPQGPFSLKGALIKAPSVDGTALCSPRVSLRPRHAYRARRCETR